MYEVFEHTADIGLRARAASLEELFAEMARAMFAVIVPNLDAVRPLQQFTVELPDTRTDDLLRDWLAELLYFSGTRHVLLCDFDVRLASGLRAVVRGEPIDPQRHLLGMEIKAVTYHDLKVVPSDSGWLAEVIVDI